MSGDTAADGMESASRDPNSTSEAASLSPGLATDVQIRLSLHELRPEAESIYKECYDAISYFVSVEFPRHVDGVHESQTIITNQVINDYVELLRSSETGNGRSCVRSARSLLEHAANFACVATSHQFAQRYLDYLTIVDSAWGSLSLIESSLTGNARRSETHRRKTRLRDASRGAEELYDKYGPGFKRNWHPTDLRTRIENLAWPANYYEFYRFSSMVLHGAIAGKTGSVRTIDGARVYRTGPALELVSDSLIYGLAFLQQFLADYTTSISSSFVVAQLSETSQNLKREWIQLRTSLADLDASLWPKNSPIDTFLAAEVGEGNPARWFLVHAEHEVFTPVDEPSDLPSDFEAIIQSLAEEPRSSARPIGSFGGPSRRLMTIGMLSISADPPEEAVWRSTSDLFGQFRRPDYFIVTEQGRATLLTREVAASRFGQGGAKT